VTSDFDIAPGNVRAFAGADVTTFVTTNVSGTPCTVTGRPAIGFYTSAAVVHIGVLPGKGGGGLGNPPTAYLVQSGAAAQFRLETYLTPINGSSCTSVKGILFGVPGSAASLRVPISLTVCGPAAVSVMEPPST
jgi:Protein of unknown function (DUF4232)